MSGVGSAGVSRAHVCAMAPLGVWLRVIADNGGVPRQELELSVKGGAGERVLTVLSRLDTDNEVAYFRCGGILQCVLNKLVDEAA